jgi:DNA processing protein
MQDQLRYWVGFNLVKGIGPVRLQALLEVFGTVQEAWEASPDQLRDCGLNSTLVQRLTRIRKQVSLETVLEDLQRKQVEVLTWDDERYPARLRNIPQSPPVLYVRGELQADDEWAIAVVGTRRFTSYGKQVAEQIADTLARNGVTVVSGLARGIDGIAHRAALDAGGRTVAVLGSGVDHIYPPEHRNLALRMIKQGAVISDYPLGTQPDGSNFPPRNRIIAGLSRAVVVVEAGKRSGALITANYAAEQGRDVFAVPGSIFAAKSVGPNRLIQKGAHPLLKAEEVLERLEMTQVAQQKKARRALPANATEAELYRALGREPLHVDEISSRVELPVEEVTATLALMELKGMVRKLEGMTYAAVQEQPAAYRTEKEGHR